MVGEACDHWKSRCSRSTSSSKTESSSKSRRSCGSVWGRTDQSTTLGSRRRFSRDSSSSSKGRDGMKGRDFLPSRSEQNAAAAVTTAPEMQHFRPPLVDRDAAFRQQQQQRGPTRSRSEHQQQQQKAQMQSQQQCAQQAAQQLQLSPEEQQQQQEPQQAWKLLQGRKRQQQQEHEVEEKMDLLQRLPGVVLLTCGVLLLLSLWYYITGFFLTSVEPPFSSSSTDLPFPVLFPHLHPLQQQTAAATTSTAAAAGTAAAAAARRDGPGRSDAAAPEASPPSSAAAGASPSSAAAAGASPPSPPGEAPEETAAAGKTADGDTNPRLCRLCSASLPSPTAAAAWTPIVPCDNVVLVLLDALRFDFAWWDPSRAAPSPYPSAAATAAAAAAGTLAPRYASSFAGKRFDPVEYSRRLLEEQRQQRTQKKRQQKQQQQEQKQQHQRHEEEQQQQRREEQQQQQREEEQQEQHRQEEEREEDEEEEKGKQLLPALPHWNNFETLHALLDSSHAAASPSSLPSFPSISSPFPSSSFPSLSSSVSTSAAAFVRSLQAAAPRFSSRLFVFEADPPTATTQRLTSLLSGTLPKFFNIRETFASSRLRVDNLLLQMRLHGLKSAVIGDDTWEFLADHLLHETRCFPSFDVEDLHTVDDAVMELLPSYISRMCCAGCRDGTSSAQKRDRSRSSSCALAEGAGEKCPSFASSSSSLGKFPANGETGAVAAGLTEEETAPGGEDGGTGAGASRATNEEEEAAAAGGQQEQQQEQQQEETDFSLIVAHTLGVDHVGHRDEIQSLAMTLKLQQMDLFVRHTILQVTQQHQQQQPQHQQQQQQHQQQQQQHQQQQQQHQQQQPDDLCEFHEVREKRTTLVMVMGDHGMTDTGAHGGSQPEEVDAALFVYSAATFALSPYQAALLPAALPLFPRHSPPAYVRGHRGLLLPSSSSVFDDARGAPRGGHSATKQMLPEGDRAESAWKGRKGRRLPATSGGAASSSAAAPAAAAASPSGALPAAAASPQQQQRLVGADGARRIRQVDWTATAALLLGVPIPFLNFGSLIADIVPSLSSLLPDLCPADEGGVAATAAAFAVGGEAAVLLAAAREFLCSDAAFVTQLHHIVAWQQRRALAAHAAAASTEASDPESATAAAANAETAEEDAPAPVAAAATERFLLPAFTFQRASAAASKTATAAAATAAAAAGSGHRGLPVLLPQPRLSQAFGATAAALDDAWEKVWTSHADLAAAVRQLPFAFFQEPLLASLNRLLCLSSSHAVASLAAGRGNIASAAALRRYPFLAAASSSDAAALVSGTASPSGATRCAARPTVSSCASPAASAAGDAAAVSGAAVSAAPYAPAVVQQVTPSTAASPFSAAAAAVSASGAASAGTSSRATPADAGTHAATWQGEGLPPAASCLPCCSASEASDVVFSLSASCPWLAAAADTATEEAAAVAAAAAGAASEHPAEEAAAAAPAPDICRATADTVPASAAARAGEKRQRSCEAAAKTKQQLPQENQCCCTARCSYVQQQVALVYRRAAAYATACSAFSRLVYNEARTLFSVFDSSFIGVSYFCLAAILVYLVLLYLLLGWLGRHCSASATPWDVLRASLPAPAAYIRYVAAATFAAAGAAAATAAAARGLRLLLCGRGRSNRANSSSSSNPIEAWMLDGICGGSNNSSSSGQLWHDFFLNTAVILRILLPLAVAAAAVYPLLAAIASAYGSSIKASEADEPAADKKKEKMTCLTSSSSLRAWTVPHTAAAAAVCPSEMTTWINTSSLSQQQQQPQHGQQQVCVRTDGWQQGKEEQQQQPQQERAQQQQQQGPRQEQQKGVHHDGGPQQEEEQAQLQQEEVRQQQQGARQQQEEARKEEEKGKAEARGISQRPVSPVRDQQRLSQQQTACFERQPSGRRKKERNEEEEDGYERFLRLSRFCFDLYGTAVVPGLACIFFFSDCLSMHENAIVRFLLSLLVLLAAAAAAGRGFVEAVRAAGPAAPAAEAAKATEEEALAARPGATKEEATRRPLPPPAEAAAVAGGAPEAVVAAGALPAETRALTAAAARESAAVAGDARLAADGGHDRAAETPAPLQADGKKKRRAARLPQGRSRNSGRRWNSPGKEGQQTRQQVSGAKERETAERRALVAKCFLLLLLLRIAPLFNALGTTPGEPPDTLVLEPRALVASLLLLLFMSWSSPFDPSSRSAAPPQGTSSFSSVAARSNFVFPRLSRRAASSAPVSSSPAHGAAPTEQQRPAARSSSASSSAVLLQWLLRAQLAAVCLYFLSQSLQHGETAGPAKEVDPRAVAAANVSAARSKFYAQRLPSLFHYLLASPVYLGEQLSPTSAATPILLLQPSPSPFSHLGAPPTIPAFSSLVYASNSFSLPFFVPTAISSRLPLLLHAAHASALRVVFLPPAYAYAYVYGAASAVVAALRSLFAVATAASAAAVDSFLPSAAQLFEDLLRTAVAAAGGLDATNDGGATTAAAATDWLPHICGRLVLLLPRVVSFLSLLSLAIHFLPGSFCRLRTPRSFLSTLLTPRIEQNAQPASLPATDGTPAIAGAATASDVAAASAAAAAAASAAAAAVSAAAAAAARTPALAARGSARKGRGVRGATQGEDGGGESAAKEKRAAIGEIVRREPENSTAAGTAVSAALLTERKAVAARARRKAAAATAAASAAAVQADLSAVWERLGANIYTSVYLLLPSIAVLQGLPRAVALVIGLLQCAVAYDLLLAFMAGQRRPRLRPRRTPQRRQEEWQRQEEKEEELLLLRHQEERPQQGEWPDNRQLHERQQQKADRQQVQGKRRQQVQEERATPTEKTYVSASSCCGRSSNFSSGSAWKSLWMGYGLQQQAVPQFLLTDGVACGVCFMLALNLFAVCGHRMTLTDVVTEAAFVGMDGFHPQLSFVLCYLHTFFSLVLLPAVLLLVLLRRGARVAAAVARAQAAVAEAAAAAAAKAAAACSDALSESVAAAASSSESYAAAAPVVTSPGRPAARPTGLDAVTAAGASVKRQIQDREREPQCESMPQLQAPLQEEKEEQQQQQELREALIACKREDREEQQRQVVQGLMRTYITVARLFVGILFFVGARHFCNVIALVALRHHLLIWVVWAPKFLYDGQLFITLFVLFPLQLLIFAVALRRELKKRFSRKQKRALSLL